MTLNTDVLGRNFMRRALCIGEQINIYVKTESMIDTINVMNPSIYSDSTRAQNPKDIL